MEATGIIFAGLDCDADSIEEWNRWYDLEHVPPNVSMPGVMLGRRYVAPPPLHAARVVDAASGFAGGRGTFLTIYTLCGDPAAAFDDMTVLRDELYGNNRMTFPAEKKAVRGRRAGVDLGCRGSSHPCAHRRPFVGHRCSSCSGGERDRRRGTATSGHRLPSPSTACTASQLRLVSRRSRLTAVDLISSSSAMTATQSP
jgi:hypothetical protein